MSDIKWIKLSTDMFNNRKIRQIEALPDGDTIIVIWCKLLILASEVNDRGLVYLTKEIPYTENMLASAFNRPLNNIMFAMKVFQEYGMIKVIDNIISVSNWEKYQNVDSLEKIRESTRKRVAKCREKKYLEAKEEEECNVTVTLPVTLRNAIEEDKEEDKEIEGELEKEKKREDKELIVKKEKVKKEKGHYYPNDEKLDEAFCEYVEMRKKIKAPMTDRAIVLSMKRLEKLSRGDNDIAIRILNESVLNSWRGLFELKNNTGRKQQTLAEKWGLDDGSLEDLQ